MKKLATSFGLALLVMSLLSGMVFIFSKWFDFCIKQKYPALLFMAPFAVAILLALTFVIYQFLGQPSQTGSQERKP